jgi:hypothetical protein
MYPHYHLLPTVKKRLTSGRGSDVKLQSSIEVSNYRSLKKLTAIPTLFDQRWKKRDYYYYYYYYHTFPFINQKKRYASLIYFSFFLIYLFIYLWLVETICSAIFFQKNRGLESWKLWTLFVKNCKKKITIFFFAQYDFLQLAIGICANKTPTTCT